MESCSCDPSGVGLNGVCFFLKGRYVTQVELQKPVSGDLGFSVVGLRSENRGELGVFVQEIQPGSAAHWYVFARNAGVCKTAVKQPTDRVRCRGGETHSCFRDSGPLPLFRID